MIKSTGMVGLLVPSGLASDLTASRYFRTVSTSGRLAALFDFENKKVFFSDIDTRFKFSVYVAGGRDRLFGYTDCAFYLHDVAELGDTQRRFALTPKDFAQVNPNTGTAPVFRTRRDAELTTAIYARVPVLIDRRTKLPKQVWPVRQFTMFHMTNAAALFRTRQQLVAGGYYPIRSNRWRFDKEEYVSLYEGKMVQAFDHRAASVTVNPENLNRPAQPEPASSEQHCDPKWHPDPQYWVPHKHVDALLSVNVAPLGDAKSMRISPSWFIAFKDVTAPTNVRTMIAAVVPSTGVGNTLPLLLPEISGPPTSVSPEDWERFARHIEHEVRSYVEYGPLVVANLNSFAYDYLARQKVHGQHLNFFIVEQLPVIPETAYKRKFKNIRAIDIVRQEVLRLTYTSHDMAPFACDMGHKGPPFRWDEEDRRHRRARLDAIYFHLYGIEKDDAAYILDTFPIVRREDEEKFGRYLTKELILAYMNAVAAGDVDSIVSV